MEDSWHVRQLGAGGYRLANMAACSLSTAHKTHVTVFTYISLFKKQTRQKKNRREKRLKTLKQAPRFEKDEGKRDAKAKLSSELAYGQRKEA